MKKRSLLKTMLLLCALIVGSSSAWATNGTLTLSSSKKFGTASGSTQNDDNSNTWTCSGAHIQNTYSTDYAGQQFGTSSTNDTYTFSASFAGYTVTKVEITAAAGNTTPTYDISVGGVSKKSGSLSKTATTYSTGTISATGNVVITLNQNSGGKAVYLGQIVVTYVSSENPSIAVSPTSPTVFYDTEDGKFTVSYNKIAAAGKEVLFFESDGTTPVEEYNWFDADIDDDGNVEYILDVNDTENSRTAYFKVHGKSTVNGADVYSDLISITQGKYSVDYATLPFAFDKGKSDIANTTGLTHSGLGGDYGSSPYLKFDDQGDYLILKVKGMKPKELKFDIKGNSLSGTYAFTVQWSANGFDYTDLVSYSSIDNTNIETKTIDISACSKLRYIKWVYTTKKNGNVALGNIKVTPETKEVSTISGRNYGSYVTTDKLDFSAAEGITAYIATGFNQAKTAIVLEEVDVVPANTPIIVKTATQGATVNVPVTTEDASDISANMLVAGDGTTAYNKPDGYTYYFLKQDQFHKATSGTLQNSKAYFKIATSEVPANSAPALGFDFGEGTTSIDASLIDNGGMVNDNVIYDLSGRRVANPTKGLYIMNGKKFFVK